MTRYYSSLYRGKPKGQEREGKSQRRKAAPPQMTLSKGPALHVAWLDSSGVIISVNEAWGQPDRANLLRGPAFAVGRNYLELCERTAGEWSEKARAAASGIRQVLQGQTGEFSMEYAWPSPKEEVWFRFVATRMGAGPASGVVLVHANISARVVTEDALCGSFDVIVARDITERKKLEQQLYRSQRMESIGALAGGIAHDLNNILAPIMMSIRVLKDITENPQAKDILKAIEASANRGGNIVRQILSFARGLEGQRTEIQPKNVAKELADFIKDTFPKDIQLRFAVPHKIWGISGDATQVHQILLNLCLNARDAMPNGGHLNISFENCVLDEHAAGLEPQAKRGRFVRISITDTGTGMEPGVLKKIFEPFYTTKDIGKGTGLGLSTVVALVKGHDGHVHVYSEMDKGTTFKVYFPALKPALRARKRPTPKTVLPRGHNQTILVVDDEPTIRKITQETLAAYGYKVLTAADGARAVAVYAKHKEKIDLVLTDMGMPAMDGAAVIRALTEMTPNLKIIAASGLRSKNRLTKALRAKVKHFLTKPYSAETLLRTLWATLEEK